MGFLERWRKSRRQRKFRREARRLLASLFSRPDLSEISSLRPDQYPRAVLLEWKVEEEAVVEIRFGMIRHPKPLRVPGVRHEVIEVYVYDARAGTVAVVRSWNLTKRGRPGGAPKKADPGKSPP